MTNATRIAKISNTFLGVEDHGIFTASLTLDYGGSGQSVGNYALDTYDEEAGKRVPTDLTGRWVAGIISACGVDSWEKVKGRTVLAILDTADDQWGSKVIGLKPLPTERGEVFLFEAEG